MKTFKSAVQAFIADEDGVTAIEYSLIAALVGVGIVAAATTLGDDISLAFGKVSKELSDAIK